jgi:hypothetical protein
VLVLGLATRLVAAQIGEQLHLLSAATGAALIAAAVLSVLSIGSSRSACWGCLIGETRPALSG